MNHINPAHTPAGLLQEIQFPDFEVSWAGANPFGDGFCFGSEDGRLLFTDGRGMQIGVPLTASANGEPINGVAASNGWLAVTTRADLNFFRPPANGSGASPAFAFPVGAHSPTVTPSGTFVVPMGRSGLMFVKPESRPEDSMVTSSAEKEGLYFYRITTMRGEQGEDVLVCAARKGGIAITEYREGQEIQRLSTVTLEDLDVVDVCAIASAKTPFAVVAIARDGTLVFLRDVLRDKKPQTVSFPTLQGTAYRLFSTGGELFVLTSEAVYVIDNLVDRFWQGAPFGIALSQFRTIRLEAVDANLVRDQSLLVVLPDKVWKYDVDLMRALEKQPSQGTTIGTRWDEQGVEQAVRLAGVL